VGEDLLTRTGPLSKAAPAPANGQVVPAALPGRLASIDAYRGLVMLLIMVGVLQLGRVAGRFPESPYWQFLGRHQGHAAWTGCTVPDLIQPSFSFLVGVALPFSLASRNARGQSWARRLGHAVWRALILILLGIFLRSVGEPRTNFTFEDTLAQIGLGYVFLFLLGHTRPAVQWAALASILVGYWLAFVLYPLPPADFNYQAVGVPSGWPYHFNGLAAHFNKNSNLAWAFDQWLLNRFPRAEPFLYHAGGIATLNFIPTLGTMILGLIAGGWLRREWTGLRKVGHLLAAGGLTLAAGVAMEWLGVCPIVKRVWTPSWVLYSGGWCFLILAAFYLVMDVGGWKLWAFPLIVLGMNSIAAYVLEWLTRDFLRSSVQTHLLPPLKGYLQGVLDPGVYKVFVTTYQPLLVGAVMLLALWLFLFWMYRRRIFLRI
jgi:predicted acyltransferase